MKRHLPWLLLFAALVVLPFVGFSTYMMHIFILVLMWSIIGMSWNILGGYTGQVSFGHAAFFGLGAYTAGILNHHLGLSGWWGLPLSLPLVAAFCLIMGFIVLRLRGAYFSLATLAVGEVLRVTAQNLDKLTLGDRGILAPRTWVEKNPYYFIILLLALGAFLVQKKLAESKMGYFFVAIRENQDAAESMGIDTTFYKTIALAISGVLTGVAGAFYFNYMGYIDPKVVFDLPGLSIMAIMVVMIGGVATYAGPLIGAVIMVLLQEMIRALPAIPVTLAGKTFTIPKPGPASQTLFGILLIVMIIIVPNGIAGDWAKIKKRIFRPGRAV
ncbi:MAG: branched-chain amino acid ABC transporter permease [Candidatus Eisenbacteria bacterium]|nr:branched-chain amino acid ABC transporter permease [Candidatus Eisenbacteria bacterium]